MQTIITKTLPATDTKGTRVSAKCAAGRIIKNWDHGVNADANHRQAAMDLAHRLGWDYIIVSGSDGVRGYHTPIYDTMAATYAHDNGQTSSRKYRAAEVEKVLEGVVAGEIFARLKISNDTGRETRYLNVDRKVIGALLAIFNDNDVD